MSFETPRSVKGATTTPMTPATTGGASYNQLKDFSVESQRQMFIQEQERERQAAEIRRSSRKFMRSSLNQSGGGALPGSSVVMSGLMNHLETGGKDAYKMKRVGDDDDDSVADDWSLDSEESFYVGIERADYAQPNNLEMYGEEKEAPELKEDRLGIARVSAAFIDREKSFDPFADGDDTLPIMHDEKSSSLHEFMTGNLGAKISNIPSKKDVVVAMPLIATGIEYEEKKIADEDETANEQVYEQEAAEGKMFINKLVGSSSSAADDKSSFSDMVNATTPAKDQQKNTPFATPGGFTNVSVSAGNLPVLSPMALFSPIATGAVTDGEDNAVRQLREREMRKEACAEASAILMEKMKKLQTYIADLGDNNVDKADLARQLEKIIITDVGED